MLRCIVEFKVVIWPGSDGNAVGWDGGDSQV